MSQRSCKDCKWDRLNPEGKRMIQCGQGHARTFEKVIENCHAWEEKSNCWCIKVKNKMIFKGLGGGRFEINPSKAIYCPICGKKLEAI